MQDMKLGAQTLRIQKTEYKKKHYIDIRKFYEDDKGELRPTQKGISIPIEVIATVIKAVDTEINSQPSVPSNEQ